jgi:hypothetical protein
MIGGPLMANPSRVTRGDAQAVLNAFPNAGRIIRRQGIVQFNTPADPELKATIRPFSNPELPFNGRHYCAEDWHVIVVASIAGGDRSFSRQDAIAELSPITLTFTLDGAELPTDRGPIKRFLDPAPEEKAFFFQQGALLSPSDLSAGSHSVSYTEDSPLGHHEEGITFFIDPPGQGACL